MKPIFAALILFTASIACAAEYNFTSGGGRTTTAHLETAEVYRNQLAVFWTGKPLRGNWYKPCVVTITNESEGIGAGGATTFAFDRGEVFGWQMSIQGSRARLLDSVIPHEVNHTIFASVARRPLPRWLDEGCSSLFEHQTEHARLRTHAKQCMDSEASAFRRFDSTEYPKGGEGIMAIYGTGFTLVEWLLDQQGVETLFQFTMDKRLPSQKFQEYYGMTVSEAWSKWRVWNRDRNVNCLTPIEAEAFAAVANYQTNSSLPTLFVVSTNEFFCPPCHRFKVTDYGGDANFRARLDQKYNVEFVFIRDRPDLVAKYGLLSVPAFCPSNSTRCVKGYDGKEALLAALANLPTSDSVPAEQPFAETRPQPRPRATPSRPRVEVPNEGWSAPVVASPRPRVATDPQWHVSGCRCSECFAQVHARIAALEARLASVEGAGPARAEPGPAGPAGPAGKDGKDGVSIDSIRMTAAGVMEFKFSDMDEWVTIGKVIGPQGPAGPAGPPGSDATAPEIVQQVIVKDPSGKILDMDNYTLGKQPVVIQLRDNGVAGLTSRVEALEPLLPLKKRRVKVFVGDKLVDELTGDEALNPEDAIPIYLVPMPKANSTAEPK